MNEQLVPSLVVFAIQKDEDAIKSDSLQIRTDDVQKKSRYSTRRVINQERCRSCDKREEVSQGKLSESFV